MENLARRTPATDEENRYVDNVCCHELETAGIKVEGLACLREANGEVPTMYIGALHGWVFHRAWRYWIAKGPGIPPQYADPLHEQFGQVVRVDGHCGCPSPREWFNGFAVGRYHVDTQEGLNALAEVIRRVAEDARQPVELTGRPVGAAEGGER